MSESKSLHPAQPQVFTTDIAASARFYREILGFRVDYLYGEPPFYGQVSRDRAVLNLRHVDRNPLDAEARSRDILLTANIPVRDIEALHAEYAAVGVTFFQDLTRQPWGSEDFIVADPDGNLLCFASVLQEK